MVEVLLFIVAGLALLAAVAVALSAPSVLDETLPAEPAPQRRSADVEAARARAQELAGSSRREVEALRGAALDEIRERLNELEAEDRLLDERERILKDRNHHFNQHRHSFKERRAALDADIAQLDERRESVVTTLMERAALDRDAAAASVLERLDAELAAEQPAAVAAGLAYRVGEEAETLARSLVAEAHERQDQGHADGAPRPQPIPLEGIPEERRPQLLAALTAVADATTMDLGVDAERDQVTLRGQDPVGREVARRAALEVVERSIQVEQVPPLLTTTHEQLRRRIREIGERALWEMHMEGRPELADLAGTLHFRFSYGQNALLHCQETGYLCGVLAAELGLPQERAREAGMLHDIGKAVDHDVEGSHAIIGGELLRVFGTDADIVHAVKAHHFDEEPSTDLAMLTICADAISASRPGARRDTLQTYLARLEQLQEIATRHSGVERAFPLQAGREVRVVVKARMVPDAKVPELSHEIAREIEAEMQYPGVIKVTVIRETMATATAPPQLGAGSAEEPSVPSSGSPRRRRGGRRRGRGRSGAAAGSGAG